MYLIVFILKTILIFFKINEVKSVFYNNSQENTANITTGLSEIINGLQTNYLIIYVNNLTNYKDVDIDNFSNRIHTLNFPTYIFSNLTKYIKFIEYTIISSVESASLIFTDPFQFSEKIHENNLAHRLSLFIFYWGAKAPPKSEFLRFEEPMRAVVITRPRKQVFRIFYNQAQPFSLSNNLKLVNWYDSDSLGLYKTPLLPSSSSVYSKFNGRVFQIPVIHSPPWFFVNYNNNSENSSTSIDEYCKIKYPDIIMESEVCVIGGRDHNLLIVLAQKMNFKIEYLDPPERTQGSALTGTVGEDNFEKSYYNFSGGIGMIQNRIGDFLLGDVSLSWERRKAVEFSFFTLADSGAFATNAPRRLNEVFAIIRPFKLNVWPYLILTILISGPAFYFIIAIPYWWDFNKEMKIYPAYINEITLINHQQNIKRMKSIKMYSTTINLFGRSIWFTVQLFLKQSCSELYNGYRARFLTMVYWIAATYVLADVYSAQLTSQFARPALEPPIDTLEKLENTMKNEGYKLFVEKDSSSLQMLENSTEIFRRLHKLMIRQVENGKGYTIDSVEEGIRNIKDGSQKIVLGGRETLYFNIKRYGLKNFQLSHKLYTRYSAVAVQIGCPFLDSLNDVLIHLFEGGILDKLTDIEYEAMSKLLSTMSNLNDDSTTATTTENTDKLLLNSYNSENDIIKPINLRMLQGAFLALFVGYIIAGILWILEIIYYKWEKLPLHLKYKLKKFIKKLSTFCWKFIIQPFKEGFIYIYKFIKS